ncbi:quinolinate synthase NadA [Paenibacillaceae bacterium WGS1546]|uniref:quinolinate synthase NadA n=1 Tax=Cohnella sp. WGS1546 TaxID=3366810 RepID=UPI00372D73F1
MELHERWSAGMMPERYKTADCGELAERVAEVKRRFGSRLFLPGHHYQKDEVIRFADASGDSLQLAQIGSANREAEFIVFLGVHFMAETADILSSDRQTVLLPDLRAGCSMADMADHHQTERCWKALTELYGDTIIPVTYVNSTAAIKAFVGRHGGATVTSSNAADMLRWAWERKRRILFLPDQHLGRNTAYAMGVKRSEMAVWDPIADILRPDMEGAGEDVRLILWQGHCSVHQNFTPEQVRSIRRADPDRRVIVHPECSFEVVQAADDVGSTGKIIKTLQASPPGSRWAVGTEMNLVNRLRRELSDRDIVSLNPQMCPCLTMNRIDLPHLAWALDELDQGNVVNRIQVDGRTAADAKLALDRMLELFP